MRPVRNSSDAVSFRASIGQSRPPFAFEAPGYRWMWLHSLFTAVAVTIELLSQGWLILELTNSPFWVGLAASVRGSSQAYFSIVGGPIVDRIDRRKILLATQLAAALGALTIAALLLSRMARLWHVFAYLVMMGLVTAVSKTSASSLTYDVVGVHRLLNANAFQFMAASLVRIVGAVVGGIIIDRLGVGGNYLVLSGAYLAGAGALLLLKSPATLIKVTEPFVRAVTTGLHYSLRTHRIRQLLLLSLIMEAFGFAYLAMLPVMARDVLEVGGIGMGYLAAMVGAGQLAATLFVATQGDMRGKGRLLVVAVIGFGLFVIIFGLSPWYFVSLIVVTIVGAMGMTYDTIMSTLLMISVPDDMRGRILSLYYSTQGFSSLGWLGIGVVATLLSMPVALTISGGIVVISALALLPDLRMFDLVRDSAKTDRGGIS